MTGESRDLAVRATHAPLERTNTVAPALLSACCREERSREQTGERIVKSHGSLGMWQQFRQLQMPREFLRAGLHMRADGKD